MFTRDGNFRLDADEHLSNSQGDPVLGFGVDEEFQLQATSLQPLRARDGNGATASLTSVVVNSDGRIQGRFSDGVFLDVRQNRLPGSRTIQVWLMWTATGSLTASTSDYRSDSPWASQVQRPSKTALRNDPIRTTPGMVST